MRRAGGLMEAVCEPENLRLAFWKASRGKRARPDQRAYAADLEGELARLREGLLDGTYPVGNYRQFTIREPKVRVISAAAFRERVLHHALMNVLEPWFERWLVYDTYACRKGRGQLAAVSRAQVFARRHEWFLQSDVRKFFDSIPHAGLERTIERKIKDSRVAAWLRRIVETYETAPGRGLPIGNLTSQHLANLYLDGLDRFVAREKGACGAGGYVRYMDDVVVWGDAKDGLKRLRDAAGEWMRRELDLEWKAPPRIGRCASGMDFLGMRVYPGWRRASRTSLARFRRKAAFCEDCLESGAWDEATFQARMTALGAFLLQADTLGWRRKATGDNRVLRGGSWNNNARNCRSANRNNNDPANRNNNNGFRPCSSAAPQDATDSENPANRAVPAAVPSGASFPGRGRRTATAPRYR